MHPSLPSSLLPPSFLKHRACKRYATKLFLGARPPSGGPFEFMTFKEFDEQVNRTRVMLKEAGIGKGDKVGRGEGGREGGREGGLGEFHWSAGTLTQN